MATTKTFNPRNALTVLSAIVLVATEVLFVAAAAAWALAGIFKLGPALFWALEAVMIAAALFATFVFARSALKSEPLFD